MRIGIAWTYIACSLIVQLHAGDGDLKVIITNQTTDQMLLSVINTSIQKEERAQLLAPQEIVNMTLPWGYYRIAFRNTAHNKTVAVERSTLSNISNTCVAITLTPGLYPGEPYVGFSAICASPLATKKS